MLAGGAQPAGAETGLLVVTSFAEERDVSGKIPHDGPKS